MQGSRGIQHNADGATCHRLLFCSGVYQQVLLVHAAGHSQGLQGQLQAHRWDACCCGFLLCQDPHRTCPCCLGCPSLLGCHLLGWGQGQVTEHDHGSQQDSIKHSAVRIQHVDIRLHGVSTRSRLDAQLLGDAQRAEAGLQALRHGADQLGCGTPGAGHASALGRGEGGELDIDAQAALICRTLCRAHQGDPGTSQYACVPQANKGRARGRTDRPWTQSHSSPLP
mmetsp:Transcript_28155/g.76008  ORF Transcript_28155/g.76008 Transcript_28155/m.76008 type:complete len:225 (-) Transcript_28155:163-837(-)